MTAQFNTKIIIIQDANLNQLYFYNQNKISNKPVLWL